MALSTLPGGGEENLWMPRNPRISLPGGFTKSNFLVAFSQNGELCCLKQSPRLIGLLATITCYSMTNNI